MMTKKLAGTGIRFEQLHGCEVEWLNEAGDWKLKELPGTDFVIKADLVILALGFLHVIQTGLIKDLKLKLDGRGNIAVDNYQTSKPWVFAAGDSVDGASLIVSAINSGRAVAAAIDKWLREKT